MKSTIVNWKNWIGFVAAGVVKISSKLPDDYLDLRVVWAGLGFKIRDC